MTTTVQQSKREIGIAALFGVLALGPLIFYHHQFAQLFWFGDEFDLIDQIDRIGFGPWAWQVFAENFVPFFKLLWGGSVFVFAGSYGAMIVLVWLTHALNTYLLGRLLRTVGFPWIAVIFSQLIFGLSPTNVETLAWSVQWSAVLATSFMLSGLLVLFQATGPAPGRPSAAVWTICAQSLASAWCFSRGVLTGALLAMDAILFETGRLPPRLLRAGLWLFPAVLTAGLIAGFAHGNQDHMAGHGAEMLHYGLCFLCLNPFRDSLGLGTVDWPSLVGFGLLKVALVGWALRQTKGSQRTLLILLFTYDLGNATLLGIGRFHTGFDTSTSSRYQYSSLLATLPFAGFWVARQLDRLPSSLRLKIAAGVLVILSVCVAHGWSAAGEPFWGSRGAASRQTMLVDPAPGAYAVPGIPFMTTERGKELIRKYHLH